METSLSNLLANLKLDPNDLELDKEVQSITSTMENMSLITQQEYCIKESTYEKFKVEKYIPLEVSNVFCRKYFDDEDFVYIKLQLPQKILDYIAHENNGDVLDYFSSLIQCKPKETFQNDDIYYNIISVFQYVLNYYQNEQYSPLDRIKTFPLGYFKWVSYITHTLRQHIRFTPETLSSFYQMSKVDQELSYGLGIIVSQLQVIIHFYEYNGYNIYNLTEQHIQRFIRLTNNLCVIMIYLKFCTTHFPQIKNKDLYENPDFIEEEE